MPFAPGHGPNGAGRPRKGEGLKELLRRQPMRDKRALVAKAYELALAGDVRWAEWIARHSGEGADALPAVSDGTRVRRIIIEDVSYGDAGGADALDAGSGDVTVSLPSGSAGDLAP